MHVTDLSPQSSPYPVKTPQPSSAGEKLKHRKLSSSLEVRIGPAGAGSVMAQIISEHGSVGQMEEEVWPVGEACSAPGDLRDVGFLQP